MKLLPQVKTIKIKDGYLSRKYIAPYNDDIDYRLKKAIDKLPCEKEGAKLIINANDGNSEKYIIDINENLIEINAEGLNGAFYAIQTLRQIFKNKEIPCVHIEDEPDFSYRGLYHDITRGKVPTIDTIKKLIDDMAYYKMNSLQLYVEHTFEFEETKEIIEKTGYITKEEIKELDKYCEENFIEFIPSIATFGHMYEILELDKYKHLRVCKEVSTPENFWYSRMAHHTIDPRNDESIELVKSLIDQYMPLFKTDIFNICGDETFDLERYSGDGEGALYKDFIKKIIDYVRSKDKKVMMWADIILKHPEIMEILPDDIYYLNWAYSDDPSEENVAKFKKTGKKQIVCPGTSSWSRLCENVEVEEKNITRLIDYGYKHQALGVLNTNWGDFANPASIDLAMYGIMLGGVKAWAVGTKLDDDFYSSVNEILYEEEGAIEYLRKISDIHSLMGGNWNGFCSKYFEVRYGEQPGWDYKFHIENTDRIIKECKELLKELSDKKWSNKELRDEMILCVEGISVIAKLASKLYNKEYDKSVDVKEWMRKYKEMWLKKNKESEISKIEEMILYIENMGE